jgi:AbiV family abortive infection protein
MTRKPEAASSDYLLRGTVFALEQCGLLLRDARILCEAGSYASAVVLTAFAREELGRYKILRGLWRRTMAGESFSVKQIPHKQKSLCLSEFKLARTDDEVRREMA